MRYREFGKTGWRVSEIGFGGWQLGGDFGKIDERESIATLHHAWDRGINFVDTAQMYGAGHSETVIGKALKQRNGGKIYVATKVQPVVWPAPEEDDPSMTDRYPASYLREQCVASLRRLGVDAIDLYQLHGWFPNGLAQREWLATLKEMQKEGMIREFGVSIRDYRPEEGVELAETGMVASQQVVYNLFEQRPADRLFPACRRSGTAVIARVPLDESALIGNWTPDTYETWESGDVRRNYFRGERFAQTYRRVERLKAAVREACRERYASLAEIALRFTLSDPTVSVVIPGMKSPEEVDLNVSVSDGESLPPELLKVLADHQWPRNFHS